MVFDRHIVIQKIDNKTEKWSDLYKLHAHINKNRIDNKYLSAGSIQSKANLVFTVRYFKELENIFTATQLYRILYNNIAYEIVDYDDYLFKHKTVKFLGVSY